MRDWLGNWYNKYAVIALIVAGSYGAYQAYCWRKLTASDWGTWVGSIGTVCALLMTIRIAHADSRRRRHEQRVLARVTAATLQDIVIRMKFEIKHAIEAVVICRDSALADGVGVDLDQKIVSASAAITRVPKIDRGELSDLIPESQRSALALAGAQGGVFSCLRMLEDVRRKSSLPEILGDINSIIFRLGVSQTLVEVVDREIMEIVRRAGWDLRR